MYGNSEFVTKKKTTCTKWNAKKARNSEKQTAGATLRPWNMRTIGGRRQARMVYILSSLNYDRNNIMSVFIYDKNNVMSVVHLDAINARTDLALQNGVFNLLASPFLLVRDTCYIALTTDSSIQQVMNTNVSACKCYRSYRDSASRLSQLRMFFLSIKKILCSL